MALPSVEALISWDKRIEEKDVKQRICWIRDVLKHLLGYEAFFAF